MQSPEVVKTGLFDLVTQSGPAVQIVLILLLASSVFSWAIIFTKWKAFKIAKFQNSEFLAIFWNSPTLEEIMSRIDRLTDSPIATVFKAGFRELQKISSSTQPKPLGMGTDLSGVENVNRALFRCSNIEIAGLEKNLGWLATIASAAPFVGLFGTVWGIMNAFQTIGQQGSANLATVAPGISEALIATAVGLAAAIPAVVFYNFFANQLKRISTDVDCFSQDFLNIVQRNLMENSAK